MPVKLDAARVEVDGGASACRPRFVLPNGGGIGYGEFHLDPASLAWLMHQPAGDRRRADARQRMGHAVGRDARRRDAARTRSSRSRSRRCRASRRAERQRVLRTRAAPTGSSRVPRPRARRWRRSSNACCAAGLDAAPTADLKAAWFCALRDVAQTPRHARLADARLEQRRDGPGLDARRAGLHQARAGARRARRAATRQAILDRQLERTKNPDRKAQFAFVRPALVGGRRRARRLVHVARRRRQPPARAVGARGAALSAPSAAGGRVRAVHRAEPRRCCRDPAHRRHLLPEAVDGRDARRPSVARRAAAIVRDVPRPPAARRIRSGCAASSCRRPTICSARARASFDAIAPHTPRNAPATRDEPQRRACRLQLAARRFFIRSKASHDTAHDAQHITPRDRKREPPCPRVNLVALASSEVAALMWGGRGGHRPARQPSNEFVGALAEL